MRIALHDIPNAVVSDSNRSERAPEHDAARALRNPVEPVSEDEAARLVFHHYGLEAKVSSLRGERDSNFLVETDGARYVLRLANSAEKEVVTGFRAAELAYIEASAPGLPVPRIQLTAERQHTFSWFGPAGRRLGQLVTYLPGVPMASAKQSARQLRQLGEIAASVSLALAGFDHPGSRLPLLWDILQADQARGLASHIADCQYRALVDWALAGFDRVAPRLPDLRRQVIHNDLNPHNIMMSHDGSDVVGIIDFGDSVHSALVNDVAVACSYLVGDRADPLDPLLQFLRAYCKRLPLTETELRTLPELIATRLALTVLITSWRASLYPDNKAYILRNQPSATHGLECLTNLPREYAAEKFVAAGMQGAA